VVNITVVSYLYYQYAHNDIKREYYQHSAKITKQAGTFYNEQIRDVVGEIIAIKYNNQINDTLKEFLISGKVNYGMALTNIARVLSEIEQSINFISSIYIFTPKGDFHDFNNFKRPGYSFEHSKMFKHLNQVEDTGLYWGVTGTDEIFQNKPNVIPVYTKYQIDGYSKWLYLIVNLDVEKMRAYLKSIKTGNDNEITIINQFGDKLVSTNSDIADRVFSDENIISEIVSKKSSADYFNLDTNHYLITYQPIKVVPWFIVNIQSEDVLLKNLNRLESFIYIISVTSIFISIVISIFLTMAIVRPLKLVEKTINKVTNGDFNVQCSYTNENEVGHLGKSFNFMIRKIRDLIERLNLTIQELEQEKKKVEEEQELKRAAELRALQAQINPHFLYNTLESIIWIADSQGAKDICQIASSLGEFYRIALSRGREIIPLWEEISHVENYLKIQKYRFGERLKYTFNVDENALECTTIKLILQPLVENSIYHGIKKKTGSGEIEISVEYYAGKNELRLVVSDNGAGIDRKTLDHINKKLSNGGPSESKGYGIFNVNERIKLFYGNQYGLRLESEEAAGTRAIITMPAFYEKDAKGGKQVV